MAYLGKCLLPIQGNACCLFGETRVTSLASESRTRSHRRSCEGVRGRCRLYLSGSTGPVLYCLHGGGYTGLTWSLVAAAVKDRSFSATSLRAFTLLPFKTSVLLACSESSVKA